MALSCKNYINDIAIRSLGDDEFLYNRSTGNTYIIRFPASLVLSYLRDYSPIEKSQLLQELSGHYEIDQIENSLLELASANLISLNGDW